MLKLLSECIVYSVHDTSFFLLANVAPSHYPSQFRCILLEPHSITLGWGEVGIPWRNGLILGYLVRLHGSMPYPLTVYNIEGEQNRTLYLLVDLHHVRRYAFSIAAYNEAGVGVFSPVIFVPQLDASIHYI